MLLMFDLELLIALRRHLDLIADAIVDLRLALNCTANDLVSEDGLVDDAVERAGGREELVIDV